MIAARLARPVWLVSVLCLLASLSVSPAQAHAPTPPGDLTQRAGIDQHLGAQLPLDARWRDADGHPVTLRQLADGHPLLLAFGYYRCPNLCDVVLHGMAHGAAGLTSLRPGRDYSVVFVGIDPRETPADAAQAKAQLAQKQPGAAVGQWHFLTGSPAAIKALTDAAGFRYFYDPRNDQFAHAAGTVVATAGGRVSQYFLGVSYPASGLRLALVGASSGKLGNVVDQLVLLCCGYDPSTGRYSLVIGRVMRVLGVGFVLLFGGWLLWWRWRARA